MYEKFISKYPGHSQAKNDLASKLNSLAWTMVTSPTDSDSYNPKLGLIYAKRCIELDDQINYVDTLIIALIANGNLDEALSLTDKYLVIYPNNEMLLENRNRIVSSKH